MVPKFVSESFTDHATKIVPMIYAGALNTQTAITNFHQEVKSPSNGRW